MEIRICCEVGKPKIYLANCCVFRLGLGPVLVDSYPYFEGDLLLRVNEQQCLWLGETSLVCSQLVNIYLQR